MIRSIQEALKFVRDAIERRKINNDLVENENFIESLEVISENLQSGDDRSRSTALSVLGHVAESSKPGSRAVALALKKVTIEVPITPNGLKSAKEKEYFAKGLNYIERDWRSNVAISLLVEVDPSASRVSDALFELLVIDFETANSLASELASTYRATAPTLNQGPSFRSRKAEQLIVGISRSIAATDMPIADQDSFADSLLTIFQVGFASSRPEKGTRLEQSAEAVLGSVRSLLRLRFRELVTAASLYVISSRVAKWWSPSSPPASVEPLIQSILEEGFGALHMFALQGVKDKALRSVLSNAFGPDRMSRAYTKIIQTDQRISDEMARWLFDGKSAASRDKLGAIEAIENKDIDERLAECILAEFESRRATSEITNVAEAIDLIAGDEARILRDIRARIEQLNTLVRAIARARGLTLAPDVGDQVAFDPSLHISGHTVDTGSLVIVDVPGVTKRIGERNQMIAKAKVRKL